MSKVTADKESPLKKFIYTAAISSIFAVSCLKGSSPTRKEIPRASQNDQSESLPVIANKTDKLRRPALILTVVIDQFRADYVTRFANRLINTPEGNKPVAGFNYLIDNGAWYPQARYELLHSQTGPGHSTILSGSFPYRSGIVLNEWFDVKGNKPVYCADDEEHSLVKISREPKPKGMSPKNFTGSTVGDELKTAGLSSRVVSIALKDRSAIFLGGKGPDYVLWMDGESMRWTSSSYYIKDDTLPQWVEELNSAIAAQKGKEFEWKKGEPLSGHALDRPDVQSSENQKVLSTSSEFFPQKIPLGISKSLASPVGLALTTDAAILAANSLALGTHADPDLLAVSYSSFDMVGHQFGPNHQIMEEMTAAVDQELARLFNAIASMVPGGLSNVLIVLTADHGIVNQPEYLTSHGSQTAGRIHGDKLLADLEIALTAKLGRPKQQKWIAHHDHLNFYLDRSNFSDKKTNLAEAEETLADELRRHPAIAAAFTANDVIQRRLPPGRWEKQILNTYQEGRSGDVVGIPKPYYVIGDITVDHYTGYSYDATVPIFLAGPSIKKGRFGQDARVNDIAPTISFLTGTIPPALSEGRVLSEALAE